MFFGHCHRTRFCDSFCLASMFEMTLLTYLLTYLLTCQIISNDITYLCLAMLHTQTQKCHHVMPCA